MASGDPPVPPDAEEGGFGAASEEPPPPPPPHARAQAAGAPGSRAGAARRREVPGDDGPPPPPPRDRGHGDLLPPLGPEPRPRRARRVAWILGAVAVVAIIGIPVALAIAGLLSSSSDAGSSGRQAGEDQTNEASELDPPDLDRLSGRDEALARLLRQVDASEQAMMAFQDRLGEVMDQAGELEPDEALSRVRVAARDGGEALADARDELTSPLDDGSLEEVRSAYLEHHDAWADYLDALVEDPSMLVGGEEARWRLAINTSAETFARTLRDEVEQGTDAEVRSYALAILRRGFETDEVVPDV